MKNTLLIRTIWIRFCMVVTLLYLTGSFPLFAQKMATPSDRITLRGEVVDESGQAVVGATVILDNSNRVCLTDDDGNFALGDIPYSGEIHVYMFGYSTKRYHYTGTEKVKITLSETQSMLDEAVVVGYASQVKANLTGAVEQISGASLENRPLPNLSRGLQGLIPNLNITMHDGNPSRSPSFNVRGATSIGSGGAALVLVDGVESDPNMINPNDIESISVLKDASSAAVYGSRGTYGVILITTKSPVGNRKPVVNYSGNYIINQRIIVPDLVTDGYTWADYFNRAHYGWYNAYPTAINSNFPFSQEYLSELKRRSENPSLPKYEVSTANGRYLYYDSHDWLKDLYKDAYNGTEHNLSVSQASDNMSLYLSGRIFDQEGIYRYNSDHYRTYNFMAKGSIKLNNRIELSNNFEYANTNYQEPLYYGGFGFTSEISMGWSMRAFPVTPMLNPDGTITEMGARSIGDFYYGKNNAVTTKDLVRNTINLKVDILPGILSLRGDYTFSKTMTQKRRFYSAVPYSNVPDEIIWLGDSKIYDHRTVTNYNGFNLYTNATFDLSGGSSFKAIVGFNGEQSDYSYFEASRDKLLYPDNPSFSLSDGVNYETIDRISDWATMGLFARLNYSFRNRYLVEFNGRYDGSSKFPSTQRWGFFPSVSGAWRLTEEPFWSLSKDLFSQIKLRGSWGSLGNGNIAPYSYLESMSVLRSNRIINGVYPTVTKNPSVIPDGLTWEIATTTNAGIDIGAIKSRLHLSFDIYTRNTTNMFTVGPTLPDIFGAEVPKGNYADMKTKGWELSLEWRDKSGSSKALSYGLRVVFADNTSKITRYYNPTGTLLDYYEGMHLGEIWGFVTDGLFVDQADIDSHPSQSLFRSNSTADMRPGDIKFKKLDSTRDYISTGNNTKDDPGDRKIIGNTSPRYTYGVNLDVDWRHFALSLFVQGVGKRDWYPPAESFYFWGQYNRPYSPIPRQMLGTIYDEDPNHVNPNAYFPRYAGLNAQNGAGLLNQIQTRYLQNAAYCRLKNVTLSYTIPALITRKAGIDRAMIYITGQNLLTWSKLSKYAGNIDPETIESINPDTGGSNFGGGNGYPMTKSYTIGLNLKF